MSAPFVMHCGDMRSILADMPASSVDACVTDPPYELDFMGQKWDASGVSFQPKTWRAVYRVLKPGGYLLAFGGTRTYHRIAVAIEDAGFELRDTLSWMHGQGFPKSMDASLAIDKAARTGNRPDRKVADPGNNAVFSPTVGVIDKGTPNHPLAKRYDGFGTALKPAFEPVIMARKPFPGTVAQNLARFGTGALNIDACRIPTEDDLDYRPAVVETYEHLPDGWARPWMSDPESLSRRQAALDRAAEKGNTLGRFPANVVLSCECDGQHQPDCPVTMLGPQARFFYHAKPSAAERNRGLDGWEKKANRINAPRKSEAEKFSTLKANHHPTVKPIKLMEWLVKLVTPPNGTVLDPFTGSGTTGIAAVINGFSFIGCEQSRQFHDIAVARIAYAANHGAEQE